MGEDVERREDSEREEHTDSLAHGLRSTPSEQIVQSPNDDRDSVPGLPLARAQHWRIDRGQPVQPAVHKSVQKRAKAGEAVERVFLMVRFVLPLLCGEE